jgi:hypothetical protein
MVSNIVGAANISNYSTGREGRLFEHGRVGPVLWTGRYGEPSNDISFWLSAGPSCSMPAMVVALR